MALVGLRRFMGLWPSGELESIHYIRSGLAVWASSLRSSVKIAGGVAQGFRVRALAPGQAWRRSSPSTRVNRLP